MEETEYNIQIKTISDQMINDGVSPDEQDTEILEKYHDFAKQKFDLDDKSALQLVYESLLYLKIKSSDSVDPLQEGDKFGIGFS